MFLRRIQVISRFIEFCDSAEFPQRGPFEYFSMLVNAKDLHDDSTSDSLLCVLLDLVGNALQQTTTSTKCFVWSLVFEACVAFEHVLGTFKTSCHSKLALGRT